MGIVMWDVCVTGWFMGCVCDRVVHMIIFKKVLSVPPYFMVRKGGGENF